MKPPKSDRPIDRHYCRQFHALVLGECHSKYAPDTLSRSSALVMDSVIEIGFWRTRACFIRVWQFCFGRFASDITVYFGMRVFAEFETFNVYSLIIPRRLSQRCSVTSHTLCSFANLSNATKMLSNYYGNSFVNNAFLSHDRNRVIGFRCLSADKSYILVT